MKQINGKIKQFSGIGKTQHHTGICDPQIAYPFIDISLKNLMFYKDLDKLISKFVHKSRPPSISSLFIHKKVKVREHILLDIKR